MKSEKKDRERGKPLIKGNFTLRKYPGKGGWTYLSLPKPPGLGKHPFGFNRVNGAIDDLQFSGLSIWNTKHGDLFFPVKAEIRKAIRKEQGDNVSLELYPDSKFTVPLPPDALHQLLKEEPEARRAFKKLPAARQRELEQWVSAARGDEARVERLAKVLEKMVRA